MNIEEIINSPDFAECKSKLQKLLRKMEVYDEQLEATTKSEFVKSGLSDFGAGLLTSSMSNANADFIYELMIDDVRKYLESKSVDASYENISSIIRWSVGFG